MPLSPVSSSYLSPRMRCKWNQRFRQCSNSRSFQSLSIVGSGEGPRSVILDFPTPSFIGVSENTRMRRSRFSLVATAFPTFYPVMCGFGFTHSFFLRWSTMQSRFPYELWDTLCCAALLCGSERGLFATEVRNSRDEHTALKVYMYNI